MGQKTSCIQGIPDWVGPYEKSDKASPMSKGSSKEFYHRLHQLLIQGIDTKDYSAIEDFLLSNIKNGAPESCINEIYPNLKEPATPAKTSIKIEEFLTTSLHKEISCKSVNFSDKPKDVKVVNMKPIIVRKDCAIHGTGHKCRDHVPVQVAQPHHQQTNDNQNIRNNTRGYSATAIDRTLVPRSSNRGKNTVRSSEGSSIHSLLSTLPQHRHPKAQQSTNVLGAVSSVQKAQQFTNVSAAISTVQSHTVTCIEDTQNFVTKRLPVLHVGLNPTLINKSQKEINIKVPHEEHSLTEQEQKYEVNDFIEKWLKDLIPVERRPTLSSDLSAANEIQSAKDIIKQLEEEAESIVETFCLVSKHLQHNDWPRFSTSVDILRRDIQKVLEEYISLKSTDMEEIKIKNRVTGALNKLSSHLSDLKEISKYANYKELWPLLRQLGDSLYELMEFLISKELKMITRSISSERNNYSVEVALYILAEVATTGDFMAQIIVKVGGIQQLQKFCQSDCNSKLKAMALRTMTMLCANHSASSQKELASYFDCIIPILSQRQTKEKTTCEALALLVTILQNAENSTMQLMTNEHLDILISLLNELAEIRGSSEIAWLSKTAIKIIKIRVPEVPCTSDISKLGIQSRPAISKQESYV